MVGGEGGDMAGGREAVMGRPLIEDTAWSSVMMSWRRSEYDEEVLLQRSCAICECVRSIGDLFFFFFFY